MKARTKDCVALFVLFVTLTLLLIDLEMNEDIDWTWTSVLAPIWIPLATVLLALARVVAADWFLTGVMTNGTREQQEEYGNEG